MELKLLSRVDGDYESVFEAFDQQLFEYLLPPNAKLIRFDGSKVGDIVHLAFTAPIKTEWVSEITAVHHGEGERFFIDEGRKLPFGLKSWRHKHIVREEEGTTIIEDQIQYSSGLLLLDWLMYPVLFAAFYPRKRQYGTYFKAYQLS